MFETDLRQFLGRVHWDGLLMDLKMWAGEAPKDIAFQRHLEETALEHPKGATIAMLLQTVGSQANQSHH